MADSIHERLLRARARARVIDLREFTDFTQDALKKSAPVALGVVIGRVVSRLVECYVDAFVAPTVSLFLRLIRSRARVDTLNVTIFGVVFPIGVAFDATLDAAATILVIFLALKCVVRGWPATKPCPVQQRRSCTVFASRRSLFPRIDASIERCQTGRRRLE